MSAIYDEVIQQIVPLPHEARMSGSRVVAGSEVRVSFGPGLSAQEPRVALALRLLREAGIGGAGDRASMRIECRLADRGSPMGDRLAALPNSAQAYAIVADTDVPERLGSLTLLATRPLGILYAVRTLLQMTARPGGGAVAMPCATVVDWPDIGERGQWGGNTHDEVAWNARWKLNTLEESVGISVDASGTTHLALEQAHVSRAHEQGVTVVPYILHIEQVALYAGLMTRTDITSTPDPSQPLPAEYVPGLCMSSPATIRLVGDWMELIAGYEHITAIEVWLSEDRSACHCERCVGKEPFELEVRCIQEAFLRARSRRPELCLRILLTQGSYSVNDRVIAASDPDVQLSYYDGGRTYDSSHAPMIYPLLQEYARAGRWLGVYPQITHCWRTVFPFTAPQLLAARGREFADKKLSNVIGYAVPSNRHHEFNVMALAEWTWNSRGRSPAEFARAYARQSGYRSPELFAEWAVAAGEAGWWLAESRMLLRFIYNYDVAVVAGDAQTEDHRFRNAGVKYDRQTIEGALSWAARSRELAARLGLAAAADESDAVHAGLAALLCVDTITESVRVGKGGTEVREALDRLDRASAVLCRSVSSWGERVNATLPPNTPAAGGMWVRLRDTANVLFRVCDTMRAKALLRGTTDPHAAYRQTPLGTWKAADFGADSIARFSFDVTDGLAASRGHCFACFTYGTGHYAAEIRSASLRLRSAAGEERVVSRSTDGAMRVGRWEKWHELKLAAPDMAVPRGSRAFLDVELSVVLLEGTKRDRWECSGEMGFRAGWPQDTSVEG